jgi:Fe-S-cluster containining protein
MLFFIIRWLIIVDYFVERFFKKYIFKPMYKVTGSCRQCGTCCQLIGIETPDYLLKRKWLMRLIIAFYKKINDFVYQGFAREERMMLFTCNKFDKEKHNCSIHPWRPALCRNYPLLRYFNKPVVFNTCGYKVEKR